MQFPYVQLHGQHKRPSYESFHAMHINCQKCNGTEKFSDSFFSERPHYKSCYVIMYKGGTKKGVQNWSLPSKRTCMQGPARFGLSQSDGR